MSVVVKIDGARVDYDTADHVQEDWGVLQVWAGDCLVGIHREWRYATIQQDKPVVNRLVKALSLLMEEKE
jgi:hypothetical protein